MVLIATLTLLASFVVASSHGGLVSTLTIRQISGSSLNNDTCNDICVASDPSSQGCEGKGPSCQCTTELFQATVDCLICEYDPSDSQDIPQDLADWQLSLEIGATECREAGFPVTFKLQLPPDAQSIVDTAHRTDFRLRQKQTTFLALQVTGGHVGLVVVLAFAFFSQKVHRDPTFVNFCFTWIASSIFYSILLYRGTAGNSVNLPLRNVPFYTCLGQAALINGAQVMTACSTMALVIQLWINLRVAIYGDGFYGSRYKNWTTFLLLGLPYIMFLFFVIPSILLGRIQIIFADLSVPRALPMTFYCSIIDLDSFLRAIYGATFGLLAITAVFDSLIIFLLYRHWQAFRRTRTKNPVLLATLTRVTLFSLYRIVVAITYGAVLDRPPTPEEKALLVGPSGSPFISVASGVPVWVDMLQAATPLVAFLIVGLNADFFTTMAFWRKKHTVGQTDNAEHNVKPFNQ